jgi:hypothetical protein
VIVRELVWTQDANDGRVRNVRFERRVPFDLCLIDAIARAVESCVSEIFAEPIAVDAFPPVHLETVTWARLYDGNFVFDMTVDAGDLSVVIAPKAARSIVGRAFGESPVECEKLLSAMEVRVLERFVAELADRLTSIRGTCNGAVVRTRLPAPRRAYCELRLPSPLDAVIGIAVSENVSKIGPTIGFEVLEDCSIECSAQLSLAAFNIFTIAGLTPGDVIPQDTKVGPYATLNVGRDPIAAGEGGVLGDRSAFKVHELI